MLLSVTVLHSIFFSVCQRFRFQTFISLPGTPHNFSIEIFFHKRCFICLNLFLFTLSKSTENWNNIFLEIIFQILVMYYVKIKEIGLKKVNSVVFILFYIFIELIMLLYTFLVIVSCWYKEYMIYWISFSMV